MRLVGTVSNHIQNKNGYGILGRFSACSTKRIEVLSNVIERSHPLRCTPSLLYLESNCECMCHLDHRRRYLVKIIGRVVRILMLQEAVKTSNEPNFNPIPNYQVQGDLLQNGVKKPWNVPSLIATLLINRNMIMSQIQRARGDPYADTNPQNVAC